MQVGCEEGHALTGGNGWVQGKRTGEAVGDSEDCQERQPSAMPVKASWGGRTVVNEQNGQERLTTEGMGLPGRVSERGGKGRMVEGETGPNIRGLKKIPRRNGGKKKESLGNRQAGKVCALLWGGQESGDEFWK